MHSQVFATMCRGASLCMLSALLAVSGCSESSSETGASTSSGTSSHVAPDASSEDAPITDLRFVEADNGIDVTDRLGRTVHFDQPPRRIISLTPSTTEVLFAIGAGEHLVGATSHCNYPAEAEQIPRVGGGTLESLNQELIVGLGPDLVLCKSDYHGPLLQNLDRLGIPALAVGPENLNEVYDQTLVLGRITDNAEEAAAVVQAMQRRVEAVVRQRPEGPGPIVFYQVWDDPLMTAGPQSFIGDLLRLSGARNLFDETPIRYPKVSPEVVVAGDPDVILAPSTHATPITREAILKRPGWGQIRAVREGRVHIIDGDSISRCGPRLVDALEEIASVLYLREGESPAAPGGSLEDAAVGKHSP